MEDEYEVGDHDDGGGVGHWPRDGRGEDWGLGSDGVELDRGHGGVSVVGQGLGFLSPVLLEDVMDGVEDALEWSPNR